MTLLSKQAEKILFQPAATPSSTEIYFGKGVLAHALPDFLEISAGKPVVIADAGVETLGKELSAKINAPLLIAGKSEGMKTYGVAYSLSEDLSAIGADLDTTLIALGGGATTDLVGFVASTYMRGVPLILIPTTLLASVDAAIGGKNGINTPFGKNLIGTVYHPKAIFIDPDMLKTLPEKEWVNGFAEIIKMGLIYDASIWDTAENDKKHQDLILKAIEAKIAITEQDPQEHGLRRILNFGHTIGHALEKALDYKIAHGEAVAIGCLVESYLSAQLGYLSHSNFQRIFTLFNYFPLKLAPGYARSPLLTALSHDKKSKEGEPRFVLIDRIGHALSFEGAFCTKIPRNQLEEALQWMEKNCL